MWYLPSVVDEDSLKEVTAIPDSLFSNHITFVESSLKLSYDGELIQGAANFGNINITLADSAGQQQSFAQLVVI